MWNLKLNFVSNVMFENKMSTQFTYVILFSNWDWYCSEIVGLIPFTTQLGKEMIPSLINENIKLYLALMENIKKIKYKNIKKIKKNINLKLINYFYMLH